ncbi:MAG: cupredoxin domain-containing protein [Syntrophobacteraceae bacterium]|nr:cupredoxin domain-containing protein [Syntrophobacteraceae bacterium]
MSAIAKKSLVLALIFLVGTAWAIAAQAKEPRVIKITAKKFEYNPAEITLKKGVPVVLEFTSLDRLHGFKCPALAIRTDIKPGQVAKVPVTPQKVGDFEFHCDDFCGSGHGNMKGIIHVVE